MGAGNQRRKRARQVSPAKKAILFWIAVGGAGFVLLPWYALQDSIASIGWLKDYTGKDNAPALLQALKHGRVWLLPIIGFFIAAAALVQLPISRLARANGLLVVGAAGFVFFLAQGFAIGAQGWSFELLTTMFGPLATGQYGMGWGAALCGSAFAMLFALGLAERGYFNGDAFIAASVVGIAVSVAVFTFYPVIRILLSAIQDPGGALSVQAFFARMLTEKIWGAGCLAGAGRCGVAWNTLVLALLCAAGCTSLGLAFALIVSRTGFRYKRLLRALSVLPIITPPFVIGLGLILIFGRSGLVNQFLEWAFGIAPSRWIYGLQGVLTAQIFSFTPIAFLLLFALAAFFAQRRLLGRKVYTALAGKGDSGLPTPLPDRIRRLCYAVALPWAALTVIIYAMALIGGFVEQWGRDYTPTLKHYVKAFSIELTSNGIIWAGAAWNSFCTTVKLSAIAAPVTALMGILTAYILTRHRFVGRSAFEFGTMLSFAIPGTVIGVSYILAFNVPPIEITGTALVLILCNVFRNMPVGVRAGIASMAQIDKSLDEASITLGARGFTTLRRVILPLLKPALVAALVYSFVRAMTTVSAIIFLVSAEYEWATTYIINRVVNGDYGVALAYCSVLIVLMLAVIWLIQRLVGTRRLGRREVALEPGMAQ